MKILIFFALILPQFSQAINYTDYLSKNEKALNLFINETLPPQVNLDYIDAFDLEKASAMAKREHNTWNVRVNGGLIRHPQLSDNLLFILCHEWGHHFAKGPIKVPFSDWSSAEGQADYFASSYCLPKLLSNHLENQEIVNASLYSEDALNFCQEKFSDNFTKYRCARIVLMGLSFAHFLYEVSREPIDLPLITKSDPEVVSRTNVLHPSAQCRLDTVKRGALCSVNWGLPLSLYNECEEDKESRPRCWFKPIKTKITIY